MEFCKMAVKDQSHIECAISDTDLFTPAYVQSDIEAGTIEEKHPITNFDDNGPVEFFIKNASDLFIDLANTYIRVKARILKGDGTNHGEEDKQVQDHPSPRRGAGHLRDQEA